MREMLDQHNGIDVTRASDVSRTDAVEPLPEEEVEAIRQDTATFLLGEGRDGRLAEIDRHMQSALAPVSSEIIKACLPQGQEKPFPENCFSLMVLTGGKGSMVNHSQVRNLDGIIAMLKCWQRSWKSGSDAYVIPLAWRVCAGVMCAWTASTGGSTSTRHDIGEVVTQLQGIRAKSQS